MLTINIYLLLIHIAFTFIVPLKIKLSFSSFAILTLISLSYVLILSQRIVAIIITLVYLL